MTAIRPHRPNGFDPDRHHRRSIRLAGYDYSGNGAYFLTIVTHRRRHLFGEAVDGRMRLSPLGDVAQGCWLAIPDHFPDVVHDTFIIMPNHVHGILWIAGTPTATASGPTPIGAGLVDGGADRIVDRAVGAENFPPLRSRNHPAPSDHPIHPAHPVHPPTQPFRSPSRTIGSIVRGFKIGVTTWARANTDVHVVWQRNYHEQIIRSDAWLARIRAYVATNPARWPDDRLNPWSRAAS